MAGDSQKLNEGELALYSMHLSSGYIPVGVDLAARVFQVCYLTDKQKIKNKALSREAFLDFLNIRLSLNYLDLVKFILQKVQK